ncbi:MAG: tyrosine-type recombinase/integrase [Pseudomonadota bacterium]
MRPFDPEQAAHIRGELRLQASKSPARLRDLALFDLGLDAMCRASELLGLTVGDLTDHLNAVVEEFEVLQDKTGCTKIITLSRPTCRALQDWVDYSSKKPDEYLWTSIRNRKSDKPLTRMQYSRLVKDWRLPLDKTEDASQPIPCAAQNHR